MADQLSPLERLVSAGPAAALVLNTGTNFDTHLPPGWRRVAPIGIAANSIAIAAPAKHDQQFVPNAIIQTYGFTFGPPADLFDTPTTELVRLGSNPGTVRRNGPDLPQVTCSGSYTDPTSSLALWAECSYYLIGDTGAWWLIESIFTTTTHQREQLADDVDALHTLTTAAVDRLRKAPSQ
jgi:hypothetical protein